ncbi:ribbon-helix-helix domain-containing protein [Aquibium pacificus]|uniref:ribbon-helix-helix domain-containing protein n=1 Tax=Aquibium pacificus TaxID=3153579 RepID=UPI00349F0969
MRQTRQSRERPYADAGTEKTVLVGANLPPAYARNLAYLHAETGRSKKQLLQEALDMLFTAKGGAGIKF